MYIFLDNDVRNALENALELMWFSDFSKIGNARLPQTMVRSRMHELNGAILAYALEKAKAGSTNIRNSTSYLISYVYNAINKYCSDVEL